VDELFPDGSKRQARNWCRNPGGQREQTWCYTLDKKIIDEYCDVPLCKYHGNTSCPVAQMKTSELEWALRLFLTFQESKKKTSICDSFRTKTPILVNFFLKPQSFYFC
jgi:hypothetical protein